jgi:hypothetical protein
LKSKANWTAENVEKYCNCYLSEMHIGNCPGGAMNKYGWKGLAQRYYAATGLMHDREQLQGKQRTLKKMWKFCNVARSSTGLAIDEDGFIQASDKWWKDNATVNVLCLFTTPFPWLSKGEHIVFCCRNLSS